MQNMSALRHLTGYGITVIGVALITAGIHAVPGADHITNISLLYLLIVMAAAYRYGSGPAVLASLLSVLSFDWFFIEPYYTLTVNDLAEWLALTVFLITAIVISHLTSTMRVHIEEAQQREHETTILSEASGAIASQIGHQQTLVEVLRRMTDVAGSEAAAIVTYGDDHVPELIASYEQRANLLPDFTRPPYRDMLKAQENSETTTMPDGLCLSLVLEQRVLGAIFLQLDRDHGLTTSEQRVVGSLANYAAVALERHRLMQAEAQAQVILEADKLKTALLSMVSHDFRSPLASIKASVTGLLQEGVAWSSTMQRELLTGIDQETDRLNHMVGNILALSRLQADNWRPQCESVSLAEVVGAALDTFSAQENERIIVIIDPSLQEAWLDMVQIVQVLHNLIENALKYSQNNSKVELSARRQDESLIIEVADRGSGLSNDEHTQIFEQFYRAPQWRESSLPGTGIGLAICRGLVEAHHGFLTASNRRGGGTIFRITLPLIGQ